MKSPYLFIIKPVGGKLYDNVKKVGESELIVNSTIEDHLTTNRQACVESVPLDYSGPIEEGALIIVHHNTFRKYRDMRGVEKFSTNKLFGDTYTLGEDLIYAYKNDWSQEWKPISPYCFVAPIENDYKYDTGSEKALHGKMVYTNDELSSIGIENGDIVGFTPDSEYEFNIDEQKLYRINSSDICLKL
jgi:hypothetical protein